MATDSRDIRHPLAYVRKKRAWSLDDVARIVQRRSGLNMSSWRQKVYRWERGTIPEPSAQRALAEELGIGIDFVAAHPWPDWLNLVDGAEPTDAPWTADAAADLLGATAETARDDPRRYRILPSAAVAELATRWIGARPAEIHSGLTGRRVGSSIVRWATDRAEQLWKLDDLLGGGGTLRLASADLRLVSDLIRNARYSDSDGRSLYQVAADIARTAGWAAFDAGYHSAAQRFLHASLRASAAAGDTPFGAYILSMFALQAIYQGDGQGAAGVIESAESRASDRTVLAMLETWACRAFSLAGDARAAGRALNRADDLWGQRSPEDAPRWAYWMVRPSLTAEANTALIALRQFTQAEARIEEGLALVTDSAPRDVNLYLVRLAEVRLEQGRADEAVEIARRAVTAASAVDSNRVDDRVAAFADKLPSNSPPARAFRDFLAANASAAP